MGNGTKQKLRHRNDQKQQYPCDTAPLTVYLFIIIECSTGYTRESRKDVFERRTSTGSDDDDDDDDDDETLLRCLKKPPSLG